MGNMDILNHDHGNKVEYGSESFTQDELEVASILLELPTLFQPNYSPNVNNNSSNCFSQFPTWVSKKKRWTIPNFALPPMVTTPPKVTSYKRKHPKQKMRKESKQEERASTSPGRVYDEVHAGASTSTQLYEPPCNNDVIVEQQPQPSRRRGLDIDLNLPVIDIEED